MASGLYLVVVLCLTSGLWFGADAHCDRNGGHGHHSGWSHFHGKSFHFFNNPQTWSEAERFCTRVDGHLASINSHATYNFIRSVIRRATNADVTTWVGGTDAPNEGVWLWIGGPSFTGVNWGRGEPNGGRGENCMEINLRGLDYVNDANCDLRRPFVCVRRHK